MPPRLRRRGHIERLPGLMIDRTRKAHLYTPERLSRLRAAAQDGPVAHLCKQDSETDAPAIAALIETWVERYDPPANVRVHLVGADTSSFWSAFGELLMAVALDQLGLGIDMRPRLPAVRATVS